MSLDKLATVLKGGAGSGHHGHAGLVGSRGGSAPGKGGGGSASGVRQRVAQRIADTIAEDIGDAIGGNVRSPDVTASGKVVMSGYVGQSYRYHASKAKSIIQKYPEIKSHTVKPIRNDTFMEVTLDFGNVTMPGPK